MIDTKNGNVYSYHLNLDKIKQDFQLEFDCNYNIIKKGKTNNIPEKEVIENIYNPSYENVNSITGNNYSNISSIAPENIEFDSNLIEIDPDLLQVETDSRSIVEYDWSVDNLQRKTVNTNLNNKSTSNDLDKLRIISKCVDDYLKELKNTEFTQKDILLINVKYTMQDKTLNKDSVSAYINYTKKVVVTAYEALTTDTRPKYSNTVPQEANYEQREYTEEYLNSFYEPFCRPQYT
jgi:hypothetical protein